WMATSSRGASMPSAMPRTGLISSPSPATACPKIAPRHEPRASICIWSSQSTARRSPTCSRAATRLNQGQTTFFQLLFLDLRYRHPLLHCRPRAERVVPALDVRKLPQVDAMPLVARGPRVNRHVGDRVLDRKSVV